MNKIYYRYIYLLETYFKKPQKISFQSQDRRKFPELKHIDHIGLHLGFPVNLFFNIFA